MHKQNRFSEIYFPKNTYIIQMDDDIRELHKAIDKKTFENYKLIDLIKKGFKLCLF